LLWNTHGLLGIEHSGEGAEIVGVQFALLNSRIRGTPQV
jgi:hypothetical protein